MPVCRFFVQGNCRFGNNCRFEHPRQHASSGKGGDYHSQYRWTNPGNAPQSSSYGDMRGGGDGWQKNQGYSRDDRRGGSEDNHGRGGGDGSGRQVAFKDSFGSFQGNRFAALGSSQGKDSKGSHFSATSQSQNQSVSSQEIVSSIKFDIEEWENGHMWPFSCYGPNKSNGCLSGLEDLSPEELRLLAYHAEKEKRFAQYRTAFTAAIDAARQKRDLLKRPSDSVRNQLVEIYRGTADSNPFAASSAPALFNNVPTLRDIFGSNLANIQSSHGSATVSPSSSAFGDQASSVTPQVKMFGNAEAVKNSSGGLPGFSSGSSLPVFGAAPGNSDSKPAWAASSSLPVFGAAPAAAGNSDSKLPTQVSSTGLFGKPLPAAGIPTGSSAPAGKPESKTYTPLSTLTAEEKEQFTAPLFTLGHIPTRPPPIEFVR